MKVERISPKGIGRARREPNLPADFAQRVIRQARLQQRRRVTRWRVAAACAAVALVAVPFFGAVLHGPESPIDRESKVLLPTGWPQESIEAAGEYQIAQGTPSREVGDYLMPDAAPLREFASSYTDASWQYDSSWSGGH